MKIMINKVRNIVGCLILLFITASTNAQDLPSLFEQLDSSVVNCRVNSELHFGEEYGSAG